MYKIYQMEFHMLYYVDPSIYLAAGRSFVERGDFWMHAVDPSFRLNWLVSWPVGFPVMIGLVHFVTGLDLFYAAKVIAYGSFIGSLCIVYRLWWGKNRPWLLMAAWAPFYVYLLWAPFSEQVYVVFLLLTVYGARRYTLKGEGGFWMFLGGVASFLIRYAGVAWVFVWLVLGLLEKERRKGFWLAGVGLGLIAVLYWLFNYFQQGVFAPTEKVMRVENWKLFWEGSTIFPRSTVWWFLWAAIGIYRIRSIIFRDKTTRLLFGVGLVHLAVFGLAIGLRRFVVTDFRQVLPFLLMVFLWVGRYLPWRWAAMVFGMFFLLWWQTIQVNKGRAVISYRVLADYLERTYAKLEGGSVVLGQYPPAFWVARYDICFVDPYAERYLEKWLSWRSANPMKEVYIEWWDVPPQVSERIGILRLDSCGRVHELLPCLQRLAEGKNPY
ncbi:MAG: hypothetical protein ACUVRD_02580 [Bacteroidia bacterium]